MSTARCNVDEREEPRQDARATLTFDSAKCRILYRRNRRIRKNIETCVKPVILFVCAGFCLTVGILTPLSFSRNILLI